MQQSGIVASTPLLGFEIDCFVLFPPRGNGDDVYGITVYYVYDLSADGDEREGKNDS